MATTTAKGILPVLKWQTNFATYYPYNSGPVIGTDGTIYFGDQQGKFYAIDGSTGVEKWSDFIATGPMDAFPAIGANGLIYAATGGSYLYAFDSSGNQVWKSGFTYPLQSSPAIGSDGTIYQGDLTDGVIAYNGTTGAVVWDAAVEFQGCYSSPALSSNGTIFITDANYLYALASATGHLTWKTSLKANGVSPVIGSDGTIYVGGTSFGLSAINPANGQIIWSATGISGEFSPPTIGTDGTLYVSDYDTATVYALNKSTGAVKWQTGFPVRSVGNPSAPLLDGAGTLYVGAETGYLYALNSATGAILWQNNFGSTNGIYSSFAVGSDGTFYTLLGGTSDNLLAFQNFGSAYVTVANTNLVGGASTTGTIHLPGATLANISVSLAGVSTSEVGVPATVTIPAGSSQATFTIVAHPNKTSYTGGVTASFDGVSTSATFSVAGGGDTISGLSLSPTSVAGGQGSTGSITLTNPAPTGGWTVYLSDPTPAYVGLPTSVTIPAGSSSTTFPITTKLYPTTFNSAITANDYLSTKQATLTVTGDSISTIAFSPGLVLGGSSSTGTITLKSAAPTGGWPVNLVSSNPGYVPVAASVTVAAGSTTATFTVTPKAYIANYSATVTATDPITSKAATLDVQGDSVLSVAMAPSPVLGGSSSTGTVTLRNAAPAGGWVVKLSSSNPTNVVVPSSVTVASGATTATFSATTNAYVANYTSTITASDSLGTKSVTLGVYGDQISTLTISPTSLVGGAGATGTVTLTIAAPAGGWVVKLSSGSASATVPSSVAVSAGSKTATFSIATKAVTTNTVATITGSDAKSSKSATLTIQS